MMKDNINGEKCHTRTVRLNRVSLKLKKKSEGLVPSTGHCRKENKFLLQATHCSVSSGLRSSFIPAAL